jgi:hypothetical protein
MISKDKPDVKAKKNHNQNVAVYYTTSPIQPNVEQKRNYCFAQKPIDYVTSPTVPNSV